MDRRTNRASFRWLKTRGYLMENLPGKPLLLAATMLALCLSAGSARAQSPNDTENDGRCSESIAPDRAAS